jgi:hypothetical protein
MDDLDNIRRLTEGVLTPTFAEVAASPALNRDYTVRTIDGPTCPDPSIDQLLFILREGTARDSGLRWGATLVIEERDEIKRMGLAGRFLVSPLFRRAKPAGLADRLASLFGRASDEVYVSPVVLYQMRFDGKPHKFMHRYDKDVADHRVEDVTREQVLNHLLNAFDFYKMSAFSDKRPW